jgi:hypothetical protein
MENRTKSGRHPAVIESAQGHRVGESRRCAVTDAISAAGTSFISSNENAPL